MTLSGSIILLLLVAAAVALAARRLRLPYTVALVVAGLLLSASPLLHVGIQARWIPHPDSSAETAKAVPTSMAARRSPPLIA